MQVDIYAKHSDEIYPGWITTLKSRDLPLVASWFFPWRTEYKSDRYVYKLTLAGDMMIQGLLSFEYEEGFLLIEFLESASWNHGETGLYVAGPLLAFACFLSKNAGNDGVIAIVIKEHPKLLAYYESLGAVSIGNQRMVIDEIASNKLIALYLGKGG